MLSRSSIKINGCEKEESELNNKRRIIKKHEKISHLVLTLTGTIAKTNTLIVILLGVREIYFLLAAMLKTP